MDTKEDYPKRFSLWYARWRLCLSDAASIAQIVIMIVAIFGYLFTVKPLFKKETLQREIARVQREKDKAEQDLTFAKSNLLQLDYEQTKHTEQIRRLSKERTLIERQLVENENALKEAQEQKNNATSELRVLSEKSANAQEQIEDLERTRSRLETEVSSFRGAFEAVQDKIKKEEILLRTLTKSTRKAQWNEFLDAIESACNWQALVYASSVQFDFSHQPANVRVHLEVKNQLGLTANSTNYDLLKAIIQNIKRPMTDRVFSFSGQELEMFRNIALSLLKEQRSDVSQPIIYLADVQTRYRRDVEEFAKKHETELEKVVKKGFFFTMWEILQEEGDLKNQYMASITQLFADSRTQRLAVIDRMRKNVPEEK